MHKDVGRNNCVSKVVLYTNIIAGLIGIGVICAAIGIITIVTNGGVVAFVHREGYIFKSETWTCFWIALGGLLSSVATFVFGVRYVSPSIVEGVTQSERRRGIAWYLIASAMAISVLALALASSVIPLHRLSNGVTETQWRGMAMKHPDRICEYEIEQKCAGLSDQVCTKMTAARNAACPGHYCQLKCMAGTSRAKKVDGACRVCVEVFENSDKLSKCRVSESKEKSSLGCGEFLLKDVRTFYRSIIYTVAIGLGVIVMATIVSTVAIFACVPT